MASKPIWFVRFGVFDQVCLNFKSGSPQLTHFSPSTYWLTPDNPQFRDMNWQQRMQQQQQQQQQYGTTAPTPYNQLASPILNTPKSSPPLDPASAQQSAQFNGTNTSYYNFTPPKETTQLPLAKVANGVKTEHIISPASMTDDTGEDEDSDDDMDEDAYELDDEYDSDSESKAYNDWSSPTGRNATVPQQSDRLGNKLKKKPAPGSFTQKTADRSLF